MAKFDLSKTQEVQDLFQVAREQRDDTWRERFFAAIVDASMAAASEQILLGPDGFSYFVLNLPPAGQPFETFCVSHILDVCLDNGFGIVIQPGDNAPQWVFTYGNLWSFKQTGKFDASQLEEREVAAKDDPPADRHSSTVLAGQPSAGFFPGYARKVIKEFLLRKTGNANLQVLIVTQPRSVPARSFVFSVFPEDFADRKDFEDVMYRLTWFVPRHYGLLSIAKESDLAKSFAPL